MGPALRADPLAGGARRFLSRATAQTLPRLDDAARLRLLAATGVDHLLVARPLAPDAAADAELVAGPGDAAGLYLYRLPRTPPELFFAGELMRAPHLNAALGHILEPSFDPRRAAVLPGSGPPQGGARGTVEVVRAAPEELELVVSSDGPGALVVHRAHLPLWRAEVDGRPVRPVAANLYRLGLELPGGRHTVRLWVDRRPLRVSGLVAAVAAGALLWLLVPHRRRRGAAGPPGPGRRPPGRSG